MGGPYSKRKTTYGLASQKSLSVTSIARSVVGGYSVDAEQKIRNTAIRSENLPTKRISTTAKNPIVVALDNTGSMGDSVFVVWDKMPLFYGQLMLQKYVEEPDISFAAIGDFRKNDQAPLQVCNFAKGDGLDDNIESLWIEHGGGGNERESYDLAYYYYLTRCTLQSPQRSFFFSIGDEAPYPRMEKEDILSVLKEEKTEPPTFPSLAESLSSKFDEVFHILIPYGGHQFRDKITQSWKGALPSERVLMLSDPKGVIDLILGAIALTNGTRTLPEYLDDLKGVNGIREEGQSPERITAIEEALTPLWEKIQKAGVTPANDGNPLLQQAHNIGKIK